MLFPCTDAKHREQRGCASGDDPGNPPCRQKTDAVSGGKIGLQLTLTPQDYEKACRAVFCDLTR